MWHFHEQGDGRPLILLHGIGMSHHAWSPVMARLAKERRVIALDAAGFGRTPPLPKGVPATMSNIVDSLAATLQAMGISEPVDIAGNSMGGFMALEAAKRGMARSVVAISPAGLWKDHSDAHVKYIFQGMRQVVQRFPAVVELAMKAPPLRELFMAVPLSAGSWRMSSHDAIRAAKDFGRAAGFDDTFAQTQPFTGGHAITAPLTVAFGTRDWLLTRNAQHRGELPAHTRWLRPRGWGHVPMWTDPEGVARLILEGTC